MTKQRQVILEIICDSEEHLTAEQVFLLAKTKLPKIVMATVYNNLNSLTSQGLIRKLKIFGEADRFDRNTEEHEHLICSNCGKIKDVCIPDFIGELEKHYGVKVERYELNMHYTCQECEQSQR